MSRKNEILLRKRTVNKLNLPLTKATKVTFLLMSMLLFILLVPCVAVSQQKDSSEEGMNKWFQELMRNSETIVDAQVISKVSRWDSLYGRKAIFTSIKFKVFHNIKGLVDNNEFTFYQPGGTIGLTSTDVSHQNSYALNERAFFFFKNKKLSTFLDEIVRFQIWGGTVFFDKYSIYPNDFADVLKKSVTDTTAFPKYYHELKMSEEARKQRSLRLKNNQVIKNGVIDTVQPKNQNTQKDSSTIGGGVK